MFYIYQAAMKRAFPLGDDKMKLLKLALFTTLLLSPSLALAEDKKTEVKSESDPKEEVDESQLERVGNNYLFYGGADEGVSKIDMPQVRQGYLEGSNVNAIKNITSMIVSHRSYEAYNKAIKNFDSMMEKSSNRIGEVRA